MVYTPHQQVRQEVVSATAVGILDEELLLPNLITNASFDQEGYGIRDTVNIKVPDVKRALETASGGGAEVVEEVTIAEHEVHAAFRDPDGHLFFVYEPRNDS